MTAELRWVPGDLIGNGGDTCYYRSYGGASWDTCGGKTKNFTRVLSIGAFLVLL
jgi:hypothetical protein